MITFAPEEHGPSASDTGPGPGRDGVTGLTSHRVTETAVTRGSVSETYKRLLEQVGVCNIIDNQDRVNWTLGLFTTGPTSQ